MALLAGRIFFIEVGEEFNHTISDERRLGLIFNDNQLVCFSAAMMLAQSRAEFLAMGDEAHQADERILLTKAHFELAYNCGANELDYWFAGKLPRMQAELL